MTKRDDPSMNRNWSINDQSIKVASTASKNPEAGLSGPETETLGKESGYTDPHQEKPPGAGASWMGGSER